ncbi:MAG: T9SS type A sorting domain-containing protein [Candidatus Celaenobacter antarcticus]|nr:T9SS type A sorting domain-containing protein [Candidatus Celaenobacter antarcticus]
MTKKIMYFSFVFAILMLLFSTNLLYGFQYNVIGEVFSYPGCPYCPFAQAALVQVSLNPSNTYMIPMNWESDSPDYDERFFDFYTGGGWPTVIFGGDNRISYVDDFQAWYDLLASGYAPPVIDAELTEENNTLHAVARVQLEERILPDDIFITFALTDHNGNALHHGHVVGKSAEFDFDLEHIGDVETYEADFTIDPAWDLENIRLVTLIQSSTSQKIIQADQTKIIDILEADFGSVVTSGPPTLTVHFENLSNLVYGLDSIEWDLDGDGVFDSYDAHPVHEYNATGSYNVTLRITKEAQVVEITKDDYISVTEGDNISGPISGTWSSRSGDLTISGDATVPYGHSLIINQGVNIDVLNDATLTVNGIILVDGARSDPVKFSSTESWKGISVENSFRESVIDRGVFSDASFCAVQCINSYVIILNSFFVNNTGTSVAPCIHVIDDAVVQVMRSQFTRNMNSSFSGAISIEHSLVDMYNNIIVNNTGGLTGGIAIKDNATVNVINNTIAYNQGSCIVFLQSSDLSVENSILRHNAGVFIEIGSSAAVNYSCLSTNHSGTSNITSDPEFSNVPSGWGANYVSVPDYWILNDTSPCIDAGDPESIDDIEDPGNPGFALYPSKGTLQNDMGAYGGPMCFDHAMYGVQAPPQQSIEYTTWTYPNPFTGSVTIHYSIKNYEQACVEIYNLKGQLVKKITSDPTTNSNGSITWNGLDDHGQSVPAGIYLYRVNSKAETLTGKIIKLNQ